LDQLAVEFITQRMYPQRMSFPRLHGKAKGFIFAAIILAAHSLLGAERKPLPAGEQTLARAQSYFQFATTRLSAGQTDDAIQYFTKVIQVGPLRGEAYFQRAKAKLKLGDIKGAEEDFRHVLETEPNRADVYLELGRLLERWPRPEECDAAYARAFELDERSAALDELLRRKESLHDYQGIINLTTRAIDHGLDKYIVRSRAKNAIGDLEGAIDDVNRNIGLHPTDSHTFEYRAQLMAAKGAWQETLDDFIRCREGIPIPNLMHLDLDIQVLRMKLGKTDEARKQLIALLARPRPDDAREDGVRKIARFLLDEIPESDFFPMKDPRMQQLRSWPLETEQSVQWYFIGMKRLLAGNKTGAAEAFRKCVPVMSLQTEPALAKTELRALGE
jgi:tetratricopeptide (TPR) repeat protein